MHLWPVGQHPSHYGNKGKVKTCTLIITRLPYPKLPLIHMFFIRSSEIFQKRFVKRLKSFTIIIHRNQFNLLIERLKRLQETKNLLSCMFLSLKMAWKTALFVFFYLMFLCLLGCSDSRGMRQTFSCLSKLEGTTNLIQLLFALVTLSKHF